jgi:hypothetical protein
MWMDVRDRGKRPDLLADIAWVALAADQFLILFVRDTAYREPTTGVEMVFNTILPQYTKFSLKNSKFLKKKISPLNNQLTASPIQMNFFSHCCVRTFSVVM